MFATSGAPHCAQCHDHAQPDTLKMQSRNQGTDRPEIELVYTLFATLTVRPLLDAGTYVRCRHTHAYIVIFILHLHGGGAAEHAHNAPTQARQKEPHLKNKSSA